MKAIYPGTFDPMTNGHLDIVERGVIMFDSLIIGVAENKRKKPMFSIDERVEMIKKSVSHLKNVEVKPFSNLLVDFMKSERANIVLRGLRAVSDFEFELQLALMNRKLNPECETVFLMPNKKYIFLSSSMIREIAMLGGDVCELVPPKVKEYIDIKCKNGCI
ncbi:pantetheine-phosphate adenylyltransferase [Deferribacterales bacterium Es71-Z0220]|uniref:pantetheine-phosphate adenylyltransferase n=1 Tax=Deferrivibrio essentukiensis TaxID=2880922 RepID=UPI001F603E17|nr:pantetheine-phosphate adenylyltransferase [Deferrivibrio essentukiensis]MCB4204875.1 pantetheine-phosphate adenylyltransferase [Deferrivibrio essentukiensis]